MTANSITDYLTQLRAALADSDKAIVQDALSDAEEHLNGALENAQTDQSKVSKSEALRVIINEYGTPEEIAEAYREVEIYTRPVLTPAKPSKSGNIFTRFFGVFIDPGAWGALVYLLISLITGLLYFCWAAIGFSTSLFFSLFIIGLPLVVVFLISIRGLALLEGRIVEALLGVRMPRRAVFSPPNKNWRDRLLVLFKDKQGWAMFVYMILQGVLGTIYFTLFVTLIFVALLLIVVPVLSGIGLPIITLNGTLYFIPLKLVPLAVLIGILLATSTMHLAKLIGRWHGRFAKSMLVGD